MGASYTLLSLADVPDGDLADVLDWLRDAGAPEAHLARTSRRPTLAEIRAAVGASDLRVVEEELRELDWTARIEGATPTSWAFLRAKPAVDGRVDVSFDRGDAAVIALVVIALAKTCGPRVLMTGERAVLVRAGDEAKAVAGGLGEQ